MSHPNAETIAALAEGRLEAASLDATLEHVENCASCAGELKLASSVLPVEDRRPRLSSPTWWLAAAAVVAIAIISILRLRQPDPIANLVRLSPHDARVIEPRLNGGFAYAPYRGALRATSPGADANRLRLGAAAADAIDRAEHDASPEAQHAAGVATLLADDPLKAIDRLRAASEKAPNDARIAGDLAAAQLAAAGSLDRASLYPQALANNDRALRLDPNSQEALFNRALILERLGLIREARNAWETYLAHDNASAWADEARQRLARLPKATSDLRYKNDLSHLERDALQFVRQYPQLSRTHAEAEYLASNLTAARAIGDALRSATGESLLQDAVAAIDHVDDSQRDALARAQQLYLQGRLAYARRRLDEAERDLAPAARGFADARSPMALMARYYLASIRFDRDRAGEAREALEAVARETPPRYVALRAQLLWELALCDTHDDDWSAAETKYAESETLFTHLGEQLNLASVQANHATPLISLGRPDDGWAARTRALAALSREGRTERIVVALGGAATMEQRAGHLESARALLALEVENARAAKSDVLLADALLRDAMVTAESGDHDAARPLVREAMVTASRIDDAAVRDRTIADARVAEGAVDGNIAALDNAIAFYRTAGLVSYLPAAYLHRARAALRAGRRDDAMRDLDDGIAAAEHADRIVDGRDALFDEAIRFTLARGDWKRAFAYSERSRGARESSVEVLQQRLRGTTTAVLHLTTLADEVVAFAVTSNDAVVARSPIRRDRLADLAPNDLFELLIRPSATIVDRASPLIVVTDRSLERIPFAALYDARRKCTLVERVAIAVAPSAAALDGAAMRPPRSVVAMQLPAIEMPALDTASEVASIAQIYPQTRVIAARDATFRALHDASRQQAILHIAGHTELQRGSEDTALHFSDGVRATWSKIAAERFDRATIVVLAACNTLRGAASPDVRSLSLGAAFAAAGAGNVIGTLTPIADADARELFLDIHRNLAAGASPADAVRRAQLDAIAGGRLPAWQSIELLTRCIPEGGRT